MDLFQAAKKGREAAFLQLFDEHHLPLYRFAYRYLKKTLAAKSGPTAPFTWSP